MRFQACASRPAGPAEPWVWKAAYRIVSALKLSYRIAWTDDDSGEGCSKTQ